MDRKWVVNASPLIVLGKISHLRLLQELCVDIVIPDGVVHEINSGPPDDPARRWLEVEGKKWISKWSVIEPVVASWDLGLGESQVLSWAYKNPGYEAIVDDRSARNCALSLGVQVQGTIGILLLAKKAGLLAEVKPVFDQLIDVGFRINPELLKAALGLIGE